MNYIFEFAKKEEISEIFNLYKERVQWMEDNGLHQWNETDYLNNYQESYFEGQLKNKQLFVLKESDTNRVVAAAVLLDKDSRWEKDTGGTAYYIHNLVTACDVRGAGTQMLKELEKLAASHGKDYIRLDSTEGHDFLNRYYESKGYEAVGHCVDRLYHGILRQKRVDCENDFGGML